jgi:hypothetical protein
LQTTLGPSVSYEYVAQHLRQVFDQTHVAKIGFDRWNLQHPKPWLLNVGFSEQMIAESSLALGRASKI